MLCFKQILFITKNFDSYGWCGIGNKGYVIKTNQILICLHYSVKSRKFGEIIVVQSLEIITGKISLKGRGHAKINRRWSDPVLWQKSRYYQTKIKPRDNTKTPPKNFELLSDCGRTSRGRSVGVTIEVSNGNEPGVRERKRPLFAITTLVTNALWKPLVIG